VPYSDDVLIMLEST